MTEDEAKTKWCPHATIDNRHDGDASVPEGLFCIGSACMAWRWKATPALIEQEVIEQEDAPEGLGWRLLLNTFGPPRPKRWRRDRILQGVAVKGGHCGLSGAPQ